MQSFWTPIRVGIVVALAAAAFGFGLMLIGENVFSRRSTYRVYAIFDDATGLGVRSRAQIAGIPIGQVDLVELDQATSLAKVWIKVKGDYVLHKDASVTKRSESILGDYLLDIHPGSASQPVLKDGDQITIVIRQPSMNEVFTSLNKIAGDISDMTGNLRKVLGGEEGENNLRTLVARLQNITAGIERIVDTGSVKLDATLTNLQRFTGDLSSITGGEKQDIVEIIKNTRDATAEARAILKSVGEMVGAQQNVPGATPEQQAQGKEAAKNLKGSLAKLDQTLSNVQEVTDKLNKGQGTLGHLINDDKLAKNLDRASDQLNNLLGSASNMKVEVNWRSEFMVGLPNPRLDQTAAERARDTAYNPWTKNYFGLRLIPRPDKWYGIEIVDDPRGLTRRVKIQNCFPNSGPCPIVNPTGSASDFYPDEVTQLITERQLKFSVYMAKRYGPISGRFGILENTGGVGIKLHLLNDALTLSADAFEFANPLKDHPHVKLYADYRFLDHLLVTAGIDDMVNAPQPDPDVPTRVLSGRDYFIGAGLFFTDEDIKGLIGLAASRF